MIKKCYLTVVLGLFSCTAFTDIQAETRAASAFESPQQAVAALVAALEKSNKQELHKIFGADGQDVIESGDPVTDHKARRTFLNAFREQHSLDTQGNRIVLVIGEEKWPFSVPLVQNSGRWQFDVEAGREEILNRRIGGNELNAIGFCSEYVRAQQEYYSRDRDGDGYQEYAQVFTSSPGRRNGLFWFRRAGEAPSPLGPIAAQAFAEGYLRNIGGAPEPYNGYYFRILSAQGPHANGGAKSYIENGGRMSAGFALLAYPARWGVSGIMSFLVNHEGRIYQKDLGKNTQAIALNLQAFDPDPTWQEHE
jgi:hypothetical protein